MGSEMCIRDSLESYVTDNLKEELKEDLVQYGSTKGCGTDHCLMHAWEYILEAMDDGSSSCNLISIDFSKAFNSLDHAKCLEMFEKRGASKHSVDMLYAFLENRKMSVKIDNEMSTPLPINGGSPQGTLLGNIIFIIATSEIDKDIKYGNESTAALEQSSTSPSLHSPNPLTPAPEQLNTSTTSNTSDTSSIRFFRDSRLNVIRDSDEDSDGNESIDEHALIREEIIPVHWDPGEPMVVKYVDDVLGAERLFNLAGKMQLSTDQQTCSIFAKRSEELINAITVNAANLGLRVNAKKTQMVCVAGQNTSRISTFIRDADSGSKVLSGDEMKILGFHFSSKPTVDLHVEYMIKKIRKRLWLLRNLKRAKASSSDLTNCYTCFIRPVFDFCSNIYHSMLNKSLSNQLEKMQNKALRIIFGYEKSHEELLALSGLPPLQERREILLESFCKKLYSNPRFKRQWLGERIFEGPGLRRQKIVKEKFARTNRLFNSPLYTIRRKINDIFVD